MRSCSRIYNIANLTIPAGGVMYIGNYSFNSCSALLHVNLPNSLTGIGYW